jgi:hypothetical protein
MRQTAFGPAGFVCAAGRQQRNTSGDMSDIGHSLTFSDARRSATTMAAAA